MAHSAHNRAKLLDQLKFAEENGSPVPDDREVMELCGFTTVEQARTLYADLADRGLIRMAFVKGARRVEVVGSPMNAATARRIQLNLSPPPSTFLELKARAAAADVMPGRYALDLLEAALRNAGPRRAEPPPEPTHVPLNGKPLVRVAVLRAAEREGVDLHVFCSRLLDLGLDALAAREASNG